MIANESGYIAALDFGSHRIGVAMAHTDTALVSPHSTLTNDRELWQNIESIIAKEGITVFVVGLPRNLNGDDTAQTAAARQFAAELEKRFNLPVHLQDEAGTSLKAEAQLKQRGKRYNKEMIDSWAAAIILEDFLQRRTNG